MTKTGRFPTTLLVMAATLAALAGPACGGPPAPADSEAPAGDVALLANLGDLARQRVHESMPGATLQQIDVIPGDGRYEFRFVDAASSRVLSVSGGIDAKTPAAFTVTTEAIGMLAVPPSSPLDLAALRLGPDGVVAVMVRELGAATPRALTLVRQDGGLAWRVEVNGPRGIVRGTVADATGQFVREDAPP